MGWPMRLVWSRRCDGLDHSAVWIASSALGNCQRSPSREEFLALMLNPNFLSIPVRVIDGVVIGLLTGIAALAVHRARNLVRAHAGAIAEQTRIQRIFGRYVPAQVVDQLIRTGQLAPQQRDASIVFADIRGFTQLSEFMAPPQVIGMLNSLFSAATAVVDEHGGVDRKLYCRRPNRIVQCAPSDRRVPGPRWGAARALLSLVSEQEFEGHQLRLRIGVATGPVAAGTVGGGERQTYTL